MLLIYHSMVTCTLTCTCDLWSFFNLYFIPPEDPGMVLQVLKSLVEKDILCSVILQILYI